MRRLVDILKTMVSRVSFFTGRLLSVEVCLNMRLLVQLFQDQRIRTFLPPRNILAPRR